MKVELERAAQKKLYQQKNSNEVNVFVGASERVKDHKEKDGFTRSTEEKRGESVSSELKEFY